MRVTTLASIRAMQQVVDRSASTSVTAADIGAMARQVFRDGPAFTRFLQHHRHRIAPIERLIALVPPRCDILDVGCGAGSHSLYLQEKGFEVTAIDISENAINKQIILSTKN